MRNFIHTYINTGSYFGDFSTACTKKSKKLKGAILSKAKSSHDPQRVARILWTKTATSAILYGSEVIPIRKKELEILNSDAANVGKFILQIQPNSTNITAALVGGITTMKYEYYKRVISYCNKLNDKPEQELVKRIFRGLEKLGHKSSYISLLKEISWGQIIR